MLVRTHKLGVLFTIQEETELGNRPDVVSLGDISRIVTVYSTKNNVLVPVALSGSLEDWFEAHTRPTAS